MCGTIFVHILLYEETELYRWSNFPKLTQYVLSLSAFDKAEHFFKALSSFLDFLLFYWLDTLQAPFCLIFKLLLAWDLDLSTLLYPDDLFHSCGFRCLICADNSYVCISHPRYQHAWPIYTLLVWHRSLIGISKIINLKKFPSFTLPCLNKWQHCLTQMKVKVKVAQLCPTLCDPMDYTVHGILQARIVEWVAFPSPKSWSHPWFLLSFTFHC